MNREQVVTPITMPDELFRIKPLEWEPFNDRFSHGWRATTALGFRACVVCEREFRWYWHTAIDEPHYCASPEEGKQLAEQHWQEYIKQALVPVDGPQNKNRS